jgi:hypothetical protein
MARNSVIFYRSYWDAIQMLPTAESKQRLLEALFNFCFRTDDDTTDYSANLEQIEKVIFTLCCPTISASARNYENGCKGGAPLGNKNAVGHGAPKGNQNALKNKQPKQTTNDNDNANLNVKDNVNLNVKDNVNLNVKENVKKIRDNNNHYLSRIPSFSEITEYISEKNLDVDPAKFFAYYEEKGWEVVDNWQKALLGWAKKRAEWKKESAEPEDEYAKLW